MTNVTEMRAVTCNVCGDRLGFTDEPPYSRIGKCCLNLPQPWGRDTDGTYTLQGGVSEYDDEDDDGYPEHQCQECGGEEFRMYTTETETRWRSYLTTSEPGRDLFFESGDYESDRVETEGEQTQSILCTNCGHAWHGDWEWS